MAALKRLAQNVSFSGQECKKKLLVLSVMPFSLHLNVKNVH